MRFGANRKEAKWQKKSSVKRGRSAVTGKFIPVKKARREKRTSVVETVKRSKRKNK